MRVSSLLAASAALVLISGGCGFGACSPDDCPQAVDGRRLLQPVVDGLSAYHRTQGAYPAQVSDLVPRYVSSLPDRPTWATDPAGPGAWWEFRTDSTGYELTFTYYGPGANHCTASAAEPWSCSGYY